MAETSKYISGLRRVLGELRRAEKEDVAVQVESVPSGDVGYNAWRLSSDTVLVLDDQVFFQTTLVEVGNPCGMINVATVNSSGLFPDYIKKAEDVEFARIFRLTPGVN